MAYKLLNGLNLASQKIINLLDPTSAQDAVSKNYCDVQKLRLDADEGSYITTGESNVLNRNALAANQHNTGFLYLAYFTARITATVTNVVTYVTAIAAATPTICRIGVYSVAGNGDLTLLNSTTNDTTLWNATGANTKALSSTWSKVKNTRYAVGTIVVTAAAGPTLVGNVIPGLSATAYTVLGNAPRVVGTLGSQTDLPSSVTEASLVGSTVFRWPYVEFT